MMRVVIFTAVAVALCAVCASAFPTAGTCPGFDKDKWTNVAPGIRSSITASSRGAETRTEAEMCSAMVPGGWTAPATLCNDKSCLSFKNGGYTARMVPSDFENQYSWIEYKPISLRETTSTGTLVKEWKEEDFHSCHNEVTEGLGFNITCIIGMDAGGISWFRSTMRKVTTPYTAGPHTIPANSMKYETEIEWNPTNAATYSPAGNRFEFVSAASWDLPTTWGEVFDAGISTVPPTDKESYGKFEKDSNGNVIRVTSDAFLKLEVLIVPTVRVCADIAKTTCLLKTMHSDVEFTHDVEAFGGTAHKGMTIKQTWTSVGRVMTTDPSFTVEKGALFGGAINMKQAAILLLAGIVLLCCCCYLLCYCLCCKKKKTKPAPMVQSNNAPAANPWPQQQQPMDQPMQQPMGQPMQQPMGQPTMQPMGQQVMY